MDARLNNKRGNGLLKGQEPFDKLDFGFSDWTPPKPKHDIYEVVVMATKNGMSYGKFVALMNEKGNQL